MPSTETSCPEIKKVTVVRDFFRPPGRIATPLIPRTPYGSQFGLHPQSFCYTPKLKILEKSPTIGNNYVI
jgi:hypothetical protein